MEPTDIHLFDSRDSVVHVLGWAGFCTTHVFFCRTEGIDRFATKRRLLHLGNRRVKIRFGYGALSTRVSEEAKLRLKADFAGVEDTKLGWHAQNGL